MADELNIGVRPGARVKRKLNLQSQALGKASVGPSMGTLLVDSIVAYAGVAGEQYSKKIKKEVEADKAVQMSRAVEGFLPTDDATDAGYQAHVVVNSKKQALGAQARLQAYGKQDITDEQWEKAIRKEFTDMDSSLTNTYSRYKDSVELQKLSSLALREAIPKATLIRETAKIEHEIQGRINSATDTLINNAAANPREDMLKGTTTMLNALKLTEAQKDKVIISAAVNTRDPDIINLSKQYKGARKTSLYERTGALQTLEKNLKNEAIANHGIQIGIERNALDEAYLKGAISEEEYTVANVNRNRDLNNKFSTTAHMNSIQVKKDKLTVAEFKSSDLIKRIQDTTVTDFSQDKREDVQAGLDELIAINQKSIIHQSKDLPIGEQIPFIADKTAETIHYIGDLATKGQGTVDAWTADMGNLANINIPATILEADVGAFKVEQLSPTAQRGIQLIESLSPTARDEHFDKLGSREAKTLRHFMNMREMGMPLPQALARAQALTRNPSPLNIASINEGVTDVISKQENTWFRPDFPDNQEAYLANEIRQKVMIDPTPNSKSNVELVSNWMKEKWTTAGNLRLKGSPSYLSSETGLHAEKLESAMEGYIELHRERILPQLEGLGIKLSDVFPVTDPSRGTIELHTSTGFKIPGTRQSLGRIREVAADWKVEKEKRVYDYTQSTIFGKELPKIAISRKTITDEL